jgi:NAD(P)-dependent dehydrogenase (short-subunit alcohol dehydrogenase family)
MSDPASMHWVNKAAVVTGGARGQGACVVRLLVQAGATVYVLDALPSEDAAWAQLQQHAQHQPGQVVAVHGDVASAAQWEALADRLREAGLPVQGLVNNAGITGPRAPVTQTILENWERVMATNLTGSFLGIRALAPLMPRGAAIVNVSSTVGMTGYFSAAYSTSKWALRGLTRSAAMELGAQLPGAGPDAAGNHSAAAHGPARAVGRRDVFSARTAGRLHHWRRSGRRWRHHRWWHLLAGGSQFGGVVAR